MDKEKTVSTTAEPEAKKRGSRKSLTVEEKAAAARATPHKDNNQITV